MVLQRLGLWFCRSSHLLTQSKFLRPTTDSHFYSCTGSLKRQTLSFACKRGVVMERGVALLLW